MCIYYIIYIHYRGDALTGSNVTLLRTLEVTHATSSWAALPLYCSHTTATTADIIQLVPHYCHYCSHYVTDATLLSLLQSLCDWRHTTATTADIIQLVPHYSHKTVLENTPFYLIRNVYQEQNVKYKGKRINALEISDNFGNELKGDINTTLANPPPPLYIVRRKIVQGRSNWVAGHNYKFWKGIYNMRFPLYCNGFKNIHLTRLL